tara:strand:- start:516 stop:671 length:156 start_codon:yes stop_codon:yes gene_type:complete
MMGLLILVTHVMFSAYVWQLLEMLLCLTTDSAYLGCNISIRKSKMQLEFST